jgi:3-dehydroquinate synthase
MNFIQQAFQVPYSFDIIFTKNLFSSDNQAFNSFLNNFGDTRFQKKILFLIDNGVAENHLSLVESIKTYFSNNTNITLVDEILVMPGGEIVKNDSQYLDQTL